MSCKLRLTSVKLLSFNQGMCICSDPGNRTMSYPTPLRANAAAAAAAVAAAAAAVAVAGTEN